MDKFILAEYADMTEEIKDLRRRVQKLETEISNLSIVSDSVTGTRADGTIGSMRITGYPTPAFYQKTARKKKLKAMLDKKEDELQELTIKAEEHIESIKKSELRIMFRFYFLDGENYAKTAMRMNCMFPGRKIPYTDENVKKRIQRYFENVPHCPEEKV